MTTSSSTATSATASAVCLHTAEGRIVAALTMGQEDDVNDRIKELIRDRASADAY